MGMAVPRGKKEDKVVIGLASDNPAALDRLLAREPEFLSQADMGSGASSILKRVASDISLVGRFLFLIPPLEPLYHAIFRLRSNGLKVRPAISSLPPVCARLDFLWYEVHFSSCRCSRARSGAQVWAPDCASSSAQPYLSGRKMQIS